ncbi:MAG TPA: response regulator [Gammaproteobacteria bacterium]|nr:response regulator [Gammaproteobacteria bacterium]
MTGEPTVFVVDDDPSVLRAIARLLRLEFAVEAFDSPSTFLEALRPDAPGCILLDLALPGVSGLELQERLVASGCMQPVVFLSGQGSVRTSVQAMRAGALDFIEKPWENDSLLNTVRRALERDREMRTRRNASDSIARRVASLTPRESEVFRHVIAGRLNKQIAARLGTAEKTIKVHRARVMHKMSVRSVAELTRVAEIAGIRPEP